MEENKHYQIYTAANFDLAGSLVLKSSESANGVNQMVYVNALAEYEENDPTTWKYYQNICGIYYPSDKPMYVTSMDTLQEILFSKETLQFHRATARAYAFGTTYYKELVAKYPDQEQLIRGILYPTNMQEAIDAKNGTILAFNQELVEETEPSFIPMLQEWIYGYFKRWYNVQYDNIDNLHAATFYGILYAMLPGAIENIRLRLCRTNEAHSYHVREYLRCNSNIGTYLPYMTRSLAMYFYRNIKYIQANAGNNAVFDELIRKCMTERNLPLAHFNTEFTTKGMPERLTPLLSFRKNNLNNIATLDTREFYSLDDILDIQDDLADGNRLYRDELQDIAVDQSQRTLNTVVPTKLLQSSVVDYTDSERFRMADITLNHWLWLSYNDLYKAYVSFTIPSSGETISLSAYDAFIFYTYATIRGLGFEVNEMPPVVAHRVQRLMRPDRKVLTEVVTADLWNDPRIDTFLTSIESPGAMISLEAFRSHCEHLFTQANLQYMIFSDEESMSKRAMLEAAAGRMWVTTHLDLSKGGDRSFANWFRERNISVKDYTQEQLTEISGLILKEAIGANLSTVITLSDIQSAMIAIVLRLSSYSVQIDKSINTGPVIDVGQTQIRFGDNMVSGVSGGLVLPLPVAHPLTVKSLLHDYFYVQSNPMVEIDVKRKSSASKKDYEIIAPQFEKKPFGLKDRHINPLSMSMQTVVDGFVPTREYKVAIPGLKEFLAIDQEQREHLMVDTWAR